MIDVSVRGVPVKATTPDEAVQQLREWIDTGVRTYVSCAPVHLIEVAHQQSDVRDALVGAGMVLPDGAPVALAASWIGRREAKQVSGSDVFDQICRGAGRRYRHFFYGSTEDVLSLLRRRVSDLYPGIDVVGTHSPPFRPLTEEERVEEAAMINAARPDIIWVGLGAPKQDLWMAANRAHLNAPVLVGVGAVFDFVSGRKRRAPEAMRAVGLEWLYRLLQEPRRLWRRYLVANTSFVLGVAFPVLRSRLSRPRR